MATDPTPNPPAATPPAAVPAPPPARTVSAPQVAFWKAVILGQTRPGEYAVYHHSTLFYWWPVWVFGFLFALLTWFSDRHMGVVPAHSQALAGRSTRGDSTNSL